MKEIITQKLSYLALGLLFFSPQLKATDPVKVDYSDYLVNPSFEYYVMDGAVDLTDPIDVTKGTADIRLYNSALRGTPPGWSDMGITLSLPQGLYIVHVCTNGVNKAVKVLIK